MAGAAEPGHGLTTVGGRAADRSASVRARLLAWWPSVIALLLTSAALAAHAALWQTQAPWGQAPVAGAVIASAGLVWALWAWAVFRLAGLAARSNEAPQQLIEEGPYRFGRNPMYLGTTVMLLGAALGLGAPLLAASAALFAVAMNAAHIPREEAALRQRFGGWYLDYAGTTRRWL